MKFNLRSLGTQITIIACATGALIAILVAIIVAILFSGNIKTSEFKSTATGVDVIRAEVDAETRTLEGIASTIISKNTNDLDNLWKQVKKTDYDFAAIIGKSNEIIWQTKNFSLATNLYNSQLNGPYVDNDRFVSLYSQLTNDGNILIVGTDFANLEYVDKIKSNTDLEVTFIVGDKRYATTLLNSKGERNIGTNINASIVARLKNGQNVQDMVVIGSTKYFVDYEPVTDNSGNYIGAYFVGHSSEEYYNDLRNTIIIGILCVLGFAILVTFILSYVFNKLITKPMKDLMPIVDELRRGDLTPVMPTNKLPNNEIGALYKQIAEATDILHSYVDDISSELSLMAKGDFTSMSNVDYLGDFEQIKTSMNTIKMTLSEVIANIAIAADQVNQGTEQLATGATLLSESTTNQARATDDLLNTVNSISDDVTKTAENANNASAKSLQCASIMNDQAKLMSDLVDAMDNIDKKSQEVAVVAKSIEDIAFQTNILALNAAIEAARAGEVGKGFAVVADEVRNLAAKSAESSASTRVIIEGTLEAVKNGIKSAKEAAEAVEEVTNLSNEAASLVKDIANASNMQATRLKTSAQNIHDIDQSIQQNSATAEESAASCEELASQATLLSKELEKFKT